MKELSDTNREIVLALAGGEKTQEELIQTTGKSRKTISRKINELNHTGAVLYHNIIDNENPNFITHRKYKLDSEKVFFKRNTDKYKREFMPLLFTSLLSPLPTIAGLNIAFSIGMLMGIVPPFLLKFYDLVKTKETFHIFLKDSM